MTHEEQVMRRQRITILLLVFLAIAAFALAITPALAGLSGAFAAFGGLCLLVSLGIAINSYWRTTRTPD
ncbi:hypothetical protein ACPROK_17245 [Glutamicibacter soli]|uniref:Uncharacterized protein n=2 Tax=Glutamicibacter TaxID=1742989 RepID=A0A365YB94_9MICC|nr:MULTISPECIES: hypothetical protein [Micrococcaceae]ALD62748.1 hypothetical protein AFL94_00840 [Arthrobacter sp. LS16]ALQ32095.1 hypothetical protein ATC04_17170 [Arthrobacter sp. YC-RL1]KLI90390.1 hypothetical protein AA310_03360 [Arthrobacter sp. YC-RL1]MBP2398126.1 hypothetical protein [Glutamicibacter protophormiae]NAZ17642.1 hypothetical protein [Glutamicibacter soli]